MQAADIMYRLMLLCGHHPRDIKNETDNSHVMALSQVRKNKFLERVISQLVQQTKSRLKD